MRKIPFFLLPCETTFASNSHVLLQNQNEQRTLEATEMCILEYRSSKPVFRMGIGLGADQDLDPAE
jgi:hypothetical protein